MDNRDVDFKEDLIEAIDRGESPSIMEPLLLAEGSRYRGELADLAVELATSSEGFRRSLPDGVCAALAELVRAMNCYYSNLIEGHNTHPVDIERALQNDFSVDPEKRDLQLEAKAHIEVQRWIDGGGLEGRECLLEGIREIHSRFYRLVPQRFLWSEYKHTGKKVKVIPGELREYDVQIGEHLPVSPGALPRFLMRYQGAYQNLGTIDSLLAVAAAHHRLLWIHPFLDGNGRVARLLSHAMLLRSLKTGGLWSISRGLGRNEQRYKELLANCDLVRRNDLDGRGNLSEEALVDFIRFFLETSLDQVRFMEKLVEPARLRVRILLWAEEEIRLDAIPHKSQRILEALLYRGEVPRSDVADIVGTGPRQARRIVSALLERKVLTSESTRTPLRLAFPAELASQWMPGLFPRKPE